MCSSHHYWTHCWSSNLSSRGLASSPRAVAMSPTEPNTAGASPRMSMAKTSTDIRGHNGKKKEGKQPLAWVCSHLTDWGHFITLLSLAVGAQSPDRMETESCRDSHPLWGCHCHGAHAGEASVPAPVSLLPSIPASSVLLPAQPHPCCQTWRSTQGPFYLRSVTPGSREDRDQLPSPECPRTQHPESPVCLLPMPCTVDVIKMPYLSE